MLGLIVEYYQECFHPELQDLEVLQYPSPLASYISILSLISSYLLLTMTPLTFSKYKSKRIIVFNRIMDHPGSKSQENTNNKDPGGNVKSFSFPSIKIS